jgi:hypothetical protein
MKFQLRLRRLEAWAAARGGSVTVCRINPGLADRSIEALELMFRLQQQIPRAAATSAEELETTCAQLPPRAA